jgi:sterol desaturase/sphingolipid hydroxylase (fatty acid hydroxylase superfamily)
MNATALAATVGFALILIDLFLLNRLHGEKPAWREVVLNLNSGHILMWVFRSVEIAAYALALRLVNLHWVDHWPPAWQWIFALFAWDLCFYWRHRMHHRVKVLWAVHVVHHQGEHFNLSLCNRNSWYASLTDFPFTCVLALLGVPLHVYIAISSFHYAIQFLNHCGSVGTLGILERVLVTPRHHRLHHRADERYFGRNFGGTFLCWDKLFGTFAVADDRVPARYGCYGIGESASRPFHNPFWTTNEPIFQYFGYRACSRGPDRSAASNDGYVAMGAVLLYGCLLAYLNRGAIGIDRQTVMTTIAILAGTITLGGMSDGGRWALVGWMAVSIALAALCVVDSVLAGPAAWVLSLSLMAHGLAGINPLLRTR